MDLRELYGQRIGRRPHRGFVTNRREARETHCILAERSVSYQIPQEAETLGTGSIEPPVYRGWDRGQMKGLDDLARELQGKLETIQSELADVHRQLGRLWGLVETTGNDITTTALHISPTVSSRGTLRLRRKRPQPSFPSAARSGATWRQSGSTPKI